MTGRIARARRGHHAGSGNPTSYHRPMRATGALPTTPPGTSA